VRRRGTLPARSALAEHRAECVAEVAFARAAARRAGRLQSTFLGSRALAGTFLKHGMLASTDKRGANLSAILRADGYGYDGSADAIARLAMAPEAVQGYAAGSPATC